jgi:hypothetical protein
VLPGCNHTQSEIKKKADFVEKIITKVLHERGFNLYQQLKSADD